MVVRVGLYVCVQCGGVGGWVGAWVRRWVCRQTSGRGVVGRSGGNVGATSYSGVGRGERRLPGMGFESAPPWTSHL